MLLELLPAERILLSGRATAKSEVLAELARLIAQGDAALETEVRESLVEREEVMSTGIGQGIALPHARLAAIPEMRVALIRYPHGIPFRSLDDQPIRLAFAVVGPPTDADRHVKVLARIARLVKRENGVGQLLAAKDVASLRALLQDA